MAESLAPELRFDTLVVGAPNRVAVTAAHAVAEAPGAVYNPLYLHGASGTGKSHLLAAVAVEALARDGGLAVEYVVMDELGESFHAALVQGHGEAYRRRLAEAGLLLVDDVQQAGDLRELQAELLRVLDLRQRAGRQTVLAATRAPADIPGLDERLVQRFLSGLVVDLGLPDEEMRLQLLRRRAATRGLAFGDGVLEAAAAAASGTARDMAGLVNRLAIAQQAGEVLDPGVAATLAAGAQQPSASAPSLAPAADDEFGQFLTEVAATVADRVDGWRTRIAQATLRWQGEGFRTERLEQLLGPDRPADPERALATYEGDAERLRVLLTEVLTLAPELAGEPALRDPARLAEAEALVARAREGAVPPRGPLAPWRLDDLLEGASNRMALHAARTLLEAPGTRYNPLLLVGGSGVGKTHLLHGLGNALALRVPGPVACLGAQAFADEVEEASAHGTLVLWRRRYRGAAAVLLDDLHLLAARPVAQAELAALLEHLAMTGRQFVGTMAEPPAAVTGLDAGLAERLGAGVVTELPGPDLELRRAVVERLLGALDTPADPDLAAFLAARTVPSVRALHGLIDRVLAGAAERDEPPTVAVARAVLDGSGQVRAPVARPPQPASGVRSREKTVWEWPDVGERLLEEWR